jgi:hypothetical protein
MNAAKERILLMALLLPLLFWLCFGCASRVDALSCEFAAAFERELSALIELSPRYVLGGCDESGVDCSGYIYLAARRAGMPVQRTTSQRMAAGMGGWIGEPVCYAGDLRVLDLVFWTFRESRINGHCGVAWHRGIYVTHASSRRGRVVVDLIEGRLKTEITRMMRLTIGD